MKISVRCKLLLSVFALCSLASCNIYRLPEGYTGSTAVIRSSSKQINSLKGEAFDVSKIDGKLVTDSPVATPRGAGPFLALQETEVKVPVQPITLTLNGGTVYAADGIALTDSLIGGMRNVSGPLTFTPKPNGEYRVKGILDKGHESVWLVEEKTGKIVGSKITKK